MHNLVVVSHTVCMHVGPKTWGTLGHTPWDGMWLNRVNPTETCSSPHYHTKLGGSRSNRLGVGNGSQTLYGRWGKPLGMGVWLILRYVSW